MLRALLLLSLAVILAGCGGNKDRAAERAATTGYYATSAPASAHFPKFGDSAPHEWDGRSPDYYPIHGIDVSRWQGEIDWHRVAHSGVSFAFIKATEGGDYIDPMFEQNWRDAKRAGVPRGAYHYYYFCRSPEEQAKWFFRNVPKDPRALPPVLDMEWTHTSKTCTYRPDSATIKSKADRFIALLTAHYGKRPIIYTTVDFYRETPIGQVRGADFWLRSVAGHPRDVYEKARWSFWQYTGTGRVPGITGDVDINAFAGSPERWAAWREGSAIVATR
ncbi:MAG: glycoside hydrolase family 25 protein [Mangrovicoccus sp.]|nr:glycoside hydrolase family 25 protein [Mangrovicoccus sp.]